VGGRKNGGNGGKAPELYQGKNFYFTARWSGGKQYGCRGKKGTLKNGLEEKIGGGRQGFKDMLLAEQRWEEDRVTPRDFAK